MTARCWSTSSRSASAARTPRSSRASTASRRPARTACENCAAGQWDMCRNGRYTEHGIKGIHGFMRERYRAAPDRLVRVDADLGLTGVLLEPASIVAKAWAEVDRFTARAAHQPRTALVTGAGPVSLLGA